MNALDFFTIQFDGRTFTATSSIRTRSFRDRNRFSKPKLFIFDAPNPEDLVTGGMERPPYGTKGENAENDKAWRKYNRIELKAMRAFAEPIAAHYGADKISYSRKAGCSCGCSPGFILTGRHDLVGKDVYVRVYEGDEAAARAAITEEEARIAQSRAERAQEEAAKKVAEAEAALVAARDALAATSA